MRACPACNLTNPPNAVRCDCGYDFTTGKMEKSYLDRTGTLDREALRLKLKRYNMLSFAIAIPGIGLEIGGQDVGGLQGKVMVLAGAALFIGGLWFYAKMRGHHPALCLLGLLSCFGMTILYFLPKRCLNCTTSASFSAKQCKQCGAPLGA